MLKTIRTVNHLVNGLTIRAPQNDNPPLPSGPHDFFASSARKEGWYALLRHGYLHRSLFSADNFDSFVIVKRPDVHRTAPVHWGKGWSATTGRSDHRCTRKPLRNRHRWRYLRSRGSVQVGAS